MEDDDDDDDDDDENSKKNYCITQCFETTNLTHSIRQKFSVDNASATQPAFL